jgi:hypothetical protein
MFGTAVPVVLPSLWSPDLSCTKSVQLFGNEVKQAANHGGCRLADKGEMACYPLAIDATAEREQGKSIQAMTGRRSKPRRPPGPRIRVSGAQLDRKREDLLERMDRLLPRIKESRGFRNARTLLCSRYIRSSIAARLGLLQAADFLIRVLEMTPPL